MQNYLKITKTSLKVREIKLAQQGSVAKPTLFDANESINCLATPMTPTWPPQIMQQVCVSIHRGPQWESEQEQSDYSALITDICNAKVWQSVACPTCEIIHAHVCVASAIKLNSKRFQLFEIWINTRMRRRHLKFASLRCVQRNKLRQQVKSQRLSKLSYESLWMTQKFWQPCLPTAAATATTMRHESCIVTGCQADICVCECSKRCERQLGGRTEAARRQLST